MTHHSRRRKAIVAALCAWWVLEPTACSVLAMQQLRDEELANTHGAGLAFPFEDFRFEMEKTSFIQLTGSPTNLCDAGSTTVPAGCTTFRQGDLRFYGLSMSRGSSGGPAGTVWNNNVTDWVGNGCLPGTFGLGCPLSNDAIINYSNFDNPFVLRAFNYTGYMPNGTPTSTRSVLELLGPSNMDAFRWAYMGELEVGRTYGAMNNGYRPITGAACTAGSGVTCLLQVQNIILGKPASLLKPPSIAGGESATNPFYGPALRLFQYAGTTGDSGSNPATFGIQYESRLSGNYRMSVNTNGTTFQRGVVPDFSDQEGMYFMGVRAYLPLGQLHYQAIVFDDTQPGSSGTVSTNGNVTIELTSIPNTGSVYNDFYSLASGDTLGYTRSGRSDRYYQTHGYVEWGSKFPTNSNSNGMGGTGVSSLRFAGTDSDGATRAVNSTNFPASTCASNGGTNGVANSNGTNCTSWLAGTVGNVVTGAVASSDTLLAEGGIVFVSRSGSTWQVLNNQNRAQSSTLNMLWVCRPASAGDCGSGTGGTWNQTVRLERDARYDNYNPALNVNAINLGASRLEGVQFNHLKIETLGGQ